ncbi:MAG: bifunctional metallophosphatase/5'-nucleotidase [Alphaproteobacteria bacterium]|nr:bifunctional metallophosphatase/5'-nucleotidase [Alphaproteobacteria bacterium]
MLMPLLLWSCAKPAPPAPPVDVAPRSFTVLSLNDVYRIEGLPESNAGGLARVRTLRARLEAEGPVLVLHGGDMLHPSLLSRRYDGMQMIDVLSRLDGDAGRFDEHLFVVPGNHEFDKGDLDDAPRLQAAIAGSGFTWLSSNIRWAEGADGQPLIAADPLQADAIVDIGGVSVGLFGLTGDFVQPAYVAGYADPLTTARLRTGALRARGAEVVIALTHLDAQDDVALLRELDALGPDLIVGGHDHHAMTVHSGAHGWAVKGAADATQVVRTTVNVRADGSVQVLPTVVDLDAAVAPDPALQARVFDWLSRHQREFCADLGEAGPCLDAPLGETTTALEAEETAIRSRETSFGSFAADLALAWGRAHGGADVALLNSGSLRLNQDLPADSALTRRHVEELLPYPMGLVVVELSGAELAAVLRHGLEGWPGQGRFLQVAGVAFRHDLASGEVRSVTLLGEGRVVAEDEALRVVIPGYLHGGGDGFAMLAERPPLAEGGDLRTLLVAALAAGPIAPAATGRICQDLSPAFIGSEVPPLPPCAALEPDGPSRP